MSGNNNSQLKTGVVLSYITLLLSTIIPLVYTPIMLRILGQAEYGLYSLAQSVVGYLSILNMGIGTAVIKYITKYRVEGDKHKEERVFGLFTVIYLLFGVLVIICGIGLVVICPKFYSSTLSASELQRLRVLIILMTFNTFLSFAFGTFTSVVLAHEKYIFRKLMDMMSTVLAPVLNLIMLFLGFGSVGLVLSTTIIHGIMYAMYVVYTYKRCGVRPRFKNMPFNILKEVASFSVFVFIGAIVDTLYWATDKVVLGAMVGTTAVAIYNVGSTFNNLTTSMSTAISGMLAPRANQMFYNNTDKKTVSDFFIKTGRLQWLVIGFIVVSFIVFGKQFICIWAGPEYAEAYYIVLLTLVPVSVPLIQNVGISIIQAENKHAFRSLVYLAVAIVNVVTTVLCVDRFGAIGAAACTGASYIIGNGIIINIFYYKVIKIDIPLFWRNIIKMSPVHLIMLVAGLASVRHVAITGYFTFFIYVAMFTCIYIPLLYIFSMNEYEKSIVKGIFLKIVSKFKR